MRLLKSLGFTAHKEALCLSLSLLKKQGMSTLLTFALIAVTLSLPLLFSVLGQQLDQWMQSEQKKGYFSLYLKVGLSQARINTILKTLNALNTIEKIHFISAEEGYHALQQQPGFESLPSHLADNPLPAVVEVTPVDPVLFTEEETSWVKVFSAIEGIDHVQFDMDWIRQWTSALSVVRFLMTLFMMLLGCAVVLMIGNVLRLLIFQRHEEIQVLKMVGATDGMIIRPYLYMGIFYGGIGAVIASILTGLFLFELNASMPLWMHSYFSWGWASRDYVFLCLKGVLFSVVFGWMAAYLSVRRQIKKIDL